MKLGDIKGVGKITLEKLGTLGIGTVTALLDFLPKAYIDLSLPVPAAQAADGQICLLKLKILSVGAPVRAKSKRAFFKAEGVCALAEGDSHRRAERVSLVWFNQPYMRDKLEEGKVYFILGKVRLAVGKKEISNPVFEREGSVKNLKGMLSVYRTKGLIYQNSFRAIVADALKTARKESVIDDRVLNLFNLKDVNLAIKEAHLPFSEEEGLAAQRRLALEDTVEMIIAYRLLVKDAQKPRLLGYADKALTEQFLHGLTFKLSDSQRTALDEILSDLNGKNYMNRILAGDVGSGKTVVAFAAMYYAVKSGYQSALMAPTEILAAQHYNNAVKLFTSLGIKVGYLSSSLTAAERAAAHADIAAGNIDIVIGTHSLIGGDVKFKNLSFAVIDEQHKFGVNQKSLLEQKAAQADTLTLSATPIPRALSLILYEDLKISTLEKRELKSSVTTAVVPDEKLEGLLSYIAGQAAKGNKSFIVCPRIYDMEGLDIFSAEEIFNRLKKTTFKEVDVALLHGKLSSEKKESVMADFASGKTSVLISTTVVEVGIDIPSATVMAVLNADRFGLATLHQLRGRIGRGDKDGYCFLHTSLKSENERLSILKSNTDGFKIAELDFDLRGGGDFLGTRQWGDGDRGGYAVKVDYNLVKTAKAVADSVMDDGRYLQNISAVDLNKYYRLLKDISVN